MKTHLLRHFVWALLVVGLSLVFSPVVYGHGGQWRGPGDSVPPNLREPTDPTPPPPPPPPTDPSPTTPSGQPSPVAPVTPGVKPGPVTGLPSSNGPRRGTQTPPSFVDWPFWYEHNKEDIENLKWRLYHPLASPNPIFGTGRRVGDGVLGGEMRWTERKVREVVVPALLWAMDPKNAGYTDTESAAYIALAKVTRDPAHIAVLEAGLAQEAKRGLIVRDAAALALGLLRRARPEEMFTAYELDKVRTFLFDVFEDEDYAVRTRGFAAISIGLLGDQPTGSGVHAGDTRGAAEATTARLFDLLREKKTRVDLDVGLLMAIGMQPAISLCPEQRETLGCCALKGRIGRDAADPVVRAHAALALGRIGTSGDIRSLKAMLTVSRGVKDGVRRSAAIGLGLLGRFVTGDDRVEVARVLLRQIERPTDTSTTNFALISLAYLLREDVRDGRTDVLGNTRSDEVLLFTARKGKHLNRSFGALALGLVVAEISNDVSIEAWQEYREDALSVLREGATSKGLDKKMHAAFCLALGIGRDDGSREMLRTILVDRKGDKMLRGYAALALGLIGTPTPEVTKAVADALRERSSEELRRQAAGALGLLGNPRIPGTRMDAVDLLLSELKEARTQSHKGQVVLALARVGDHRAIERLVDMLRDPGEQDLTRALACAGLGLVGDLEWIPSLARGSKDVNYRASTDLLNEFLSIL